MLSTVKPTPITISLNLWSVLANATSTQNVQDSTHRNAFGHECYVKWQVEDLDNVNTGPAPPPAPPPQGDKRPQGPQVSDCLCVFDVDRTLTAKQGWYDCPGTSAHNEVPDWAYNG